MQHTTSFLLLVILSIWSEWNISEVWICKFGHKKGKDKIRTTRFLCSHKSILELKGTKVTPLLSNILRPVQGFAIKRLLTNPFSIYCLLSQTLCSEPCRVTLDPIFSSLFGSFLTIIFQISLPAVSLSFLIFSFHAYFIGCILLSPRCPSS